MENYKSLDSPLRYTVGWIAPLAIERAAAEALLDEKHGEPRNFSQPGNDRLSYSWGGIGKHNVVIASLKAGMYGTNSAATAATSMLSTFPGIRFGLLVGIGGAIPRTDGPDIRLGDVVISEPSGSTGGVIQYDLVKLSQGHRERKDFLNAPPDILLYALSNLKAQYEQRPSKVPSILAEMESRNPYMFQPRPNNPGFRHQGLENDRLFNAHYEHAPGRDCKNCSREEEVEREARGTTEPVFHFGIIASGNTLVKDAAGREELLNHIPDECICYEMEAAGLMNNFPCLVIRGISDYSDSHKNDRWQRYAAATAAAFGKELLDVIHEKDIEIADTAIDVIEKFAHQINRIQGLVEDANQYSEDTRLRNWLCPPNPSANHAKAVEKRYKNTCQWFLNDAQFEQWKSKAHAFLWVHGIAGCGKTILSSAIIEKLREDFANDPMSVVVYFYFDFNNEEKRSLAGMVRSLVHQLQLCDTGIRNNLLHAEYRFGCDRPNINILNNSLQQRGGQVTNVYVVLDGLDEVDTTERLEICDWMKDMIRCSSNNLRILVTSRSEQDIETELQNIDMTHRVLREATQVDIQAYVEDAVQSDSRLRRWSSRPAVQQRIAKTLTEKSDGMFQWVSCQLDSLGDCLDYQALETALLSLPVSLENLYGQILSRIPKPQNPNALRLLQLLAYASRPLRAEEAIDALATNVSARPAFDPVNRLPDAEEITRYCSSLITVEPVEYYDLAPISEDLKSKSDLFGHDHTQLVTSRELKLAHKSVRDYLTSDVADEFTQQHLRESIAKSEIAKVSLCYLLSLPCNLPVWEINRRLPFALWASRQWWEYADVADKNESTRATIAEFLSCNATYRTWRFLYSPETFKEMASEVAHIEYLKQRKSESKPEETLAVVPAMLTATTRGLSRSIEKLAATPGIDLEYRETWNASQYDFCPPGFERLTNGKFATPTALYKASEIGNIETVEILLGSGARAHLIGGVYGSPLSIACLNGHEQVAHLLLDRTEEGCEISMKLALLHTISNRRASMLLLFIQRKPTSLFDMLDLSIPSCVRHEQGVKVLCDKILGEDFNWLVSQVLDYLINPLDAEVPHHHVQLLVYGFKAALKFRRHAAIREIVQRLNHYRYNNATRAMVLGPMSQLPLINLAFEAGSAHALITIYKLYKPSWQKPTWNSVGAGPNSMIYEKDLRFLIASCYHPTESDMESGVWKLQDRISAFKCWGSSKTAFHLAAEHGDPELIKALLQTTGKLQLSRVNARDHDGNTPLNIAAAKGKLATATLLHLAGAEYKSNRFGLDPIAAAAANGHQDVAKSLMFLLREKMGYTKNGECRSTESDFLLPEASRRGLQDYTFARGITESVLTRNPVKVREALTMLPLEYYFEGSFQSLLERTSQPALHLAATHGSSEIVRLLIQTGADVNWQLEVGYLRPFEQSPDEEFLEEYQNNLPDSLIEVVKGHQVKTNFEVLVRPLHLAIHRCFLNVVRLLVRSGADINVISYTLHPPPPLHFAAEKSSWEMLRILLHENEAITGRDRSGATALHYAAISGSIQKVVGLVREGLRPYDEDYDGLTPLDWLHMVDRVGGQQSSLILSFLKSQCEGVSYRSSNWMPAFK